MNYIRTWRGAGELMVTKGDFIRIEYTGYDEQGNVFDSTSGETAKALHGKEGPLLVVYKHDKLIPGMEEALEQMKGGETRELQLTSEKAFGKRNKDLIRIMSEKDFYRNEIRPEVGLAIHMDTEQGRMLGTIKSVSGGRILIDFNHPLAEKNVKYTLKLADVIEKTDDKIDALLDDVGIKGKAKTDNEKTVIEVSEKPSDYEQKKQYFSMVIKSLFTEIKDVEFRDLAGSK